MASKVIELQIRPRGTSPNTPLYPNQTDNPSIGKPIKSLPDSISIDSAASTAQLYEDLAKKSNFSIHQLRITKGSDGHAINNTKDVTVHSTGVRDQSTIYVKDLGPQIGWRTVFVIEYAGPIIIHPLVYALRPYIYSSAPSQGSHLQALTLLLIVGHFVKRELETLLVHRFSASTMPFRNVFKNSFHYWVLAGANIAAWAYAPSSPTARAPNMAIMYAGILLYALGELGNLQTHLTLMNLRSPGSTERAIPRGALFDMVTCPNYMTETVSWLGIWLVSNFNLAVLLFVVIAVGQMMLWAKKKESRYRKEFGSKYKKKRFAMLPGIF